MKIHGLQKMTLLDFPGRVACTVFTGGCNLRCPFCQNHEISRSEKAVSLERAAARYSPNEIAALAESYRSSGNIGVAFTYNEPLIGWEFVRDTAKLIHEAGLKNVLVTNGTAELWVLKELSPYIDAMNIDLKGFSEEYYNKTLGGNLHTTLQFITEAVKTAHVELTTLIVPHCNDTEREMRELSSWVAGLDRDIPLHITRFFPRAEMTDRDATDVQLINRLVETAREKLRYVYTGNC